MVATIKTKTEEFEMSKNNAVVIGLAKGHEPKISEQWADYKRVDVDTLKEGDIVARVVGPDIREGRPGQYRSSLLVVKKVIFNEDIVGGGLVKTESIWNSHPTKVVLSSVNFRSVRNRSHYRLYPYNINQPTDIPVVEEKPEPPANLESHASEIKPLDNGRLPAFMLSDEMFQKWLAVYIDIESSNFRAQKDDRDRHFSMAENRDKTYSENYKKGLELEKEMVDLLKGVNEKLERLLSAWEGPK